MECVESLETGRRGLSCFFGGGLNLVEDFVLDLILIRSNPKGFPEQSLKTLNENKSSFGFFARQTSPSWKHTKFKHQQLFTPLSIDISLDGGICSVFMVTPFKCLGFPESPPPPLSLHACKFGTGVKSGGVEGETAGLGGKKEDSY